jgi:O-antigen/teichoic acid export membrane protein
VSNAPTNVTECKPEGFAFYGVLSGIIMLVTLRSDYWILGAFVSDREIGLYSVASRVALPLSSLQAAVLTVLWPRVSVARETDDVSRLLWRTVRCSVLLLAVAATYALVAPGLVPLLFGARYAASLAITRVMCFTYAISLFINPLALVGYNLNLARTYVGVHAVQMFMTVLVSFILVPRIGSIGSALGMMGGVVVCGLLIALAINRRLIQRRKALRRSLLAGRFRELPLADTSTSGERRHGILSSNV